MIKYLFRFVLLIILMTVVLLPLNYYILDGLLGRSFGFDYYLIYAYFIGLTIAIQLFLLRSVTQRPQKFVVNFMATMGGKIFLSLLLILLHVYFRPEGAKIYAVNFAALYLSYSFLGIYHILSVQRKADA